jgi:hypothetical protein
MREVIFGTASLGEYSQKVQECDLRCVAASGLALAEQASHAQCQLWLFRSAGSNGTQRICADQQHLLAWTGHIVVRDLVIAVKINHIYNNCILI